MFMREGHLFFRKMAYFIINGGVIMSEVVLKGGRYVYFKTVKEPMYGIGLGILSSINSIL